MSYTYGWLLELERILESEHKIEMQLRIRHKCVHTVLFFFLFSKKKSEKKKIYILNYCTTLAHLDRNAPCMPTHPCKEELVICEVCRV